MPYASRAIVVRRFATSIDRLMSAWTAPQQIARWWAREDEHLMLAQVNPQTGGSFEFITLGADGQEQLYRGRFRELVHGDVIVIRWETPMTHKLVLQFLELEPNLTELTLTESPFEDRGEMEACKARWNAAFDRIAALVEYDQP